MVLAHPFTGIPFSLKLAISHVLFGAGTDSLRGEDVLVL